MLECKYLQASEKTSNYVCKFSCESNSGKIEGNAGCSQCITVPSVENLLTDSAQRSQETNTKEVRSALQNGRATLVLGAGVSIPAEMPNWVGLLSQMSGYALQYQNYKGIEQRDQRLHRLTEELISKRLKILNGVNVLEAGEYVSMLLNSSPQKNNSTKTSDELMKTVISSIIDRSKRPEEISDPWAANHLGQNFQNADYTMQKKIAETNTLYAVAYLLQAEKGFRRAITYNYDTLVQECLISIFGIDEARILTHSEGWRYPDPPKPDPIEILHVHGCIPRSGQKVPTPAFPKESHRLIFSEESYYDMERYGAYDWPNSVQSYYLNRDSCIFVGFSAEDYNFRRILRQLGDRGQKNNPKGPKHYLVLTIDQLVKDIYSSVCRNLIVSSSADPDNIRADALALLEQELIMKKAYWRKYNFSPLWATINDIPKILLSFLG